MPQVEEDLFNMWKVCFSARNACMSWLDMNICVCGGGGGGAAQVNQY